MHSEILATLEPLISSSQPKSQSETVYEQLELPHERVAPIVPTKTVKQNDISKSYAEPLGPSQCWINSRILVIRTFGRKGLKLQHSVIMRGVSFHQWAHCS